MKTCGFCKENCGNSWCITNGEKMNEFDKLIEKLEWSVPYTKEDMLKAFELGKVVKAQELKTKVIGRNINGVIQGTLMENEIE